MSFSTKPLRSLLFIFAGSLLFANTLLAGQGITLYTPYTKIVVPPGETIEYNIEIKNSDSVRRTADLYVTGLSKGWSYELKSGDWVVKQMSLLPDGKKTLKLKIDVPYEVNRGTHRINVVAGDYTLPLYVMISRQGNYKTEFTCKQKNMQGTDKSNFSFSTELKNSTGEKQVYSLRSLAPRGWEVKFKPSYKPATSVEVEPNKKVSIPIEIKPPYNVKAGTYKIPVSAVNNYTTSELTLEVVITGTYEMDLTTPDGLLSTGITSGEEKKVKLLVKNTGSAKLEKVNLRASAPRKWEVEFNPKEIAVIDPGKSAEVTATIKPFKKSVAGDYVVNMTASTSEVSSKLSYRITVRTSMLAGWLGILIIILAIGSIYYLFRKYGRR